VPYAYWSLGGVLISLSKAMSPQEVMRFSTEIAVYLGNGAR